MDRLRSRVSSTSSPVAFSPDQLVGDIHDVLTINRMVHESLAPLVEPVEEYLGELRKYHSVIRGDSELRAWRRT
jgi:hypothetical protein